MRLKDIIRESTELEPVLTRDIPRADAIKPLAKFIHKHCNPWLTESDNGIVYRGIKTAGRGAYWAYARTPVQDRRPVDSRPEKHKFFNTIIDRVGGVANRSNSMFVTNSYNAADNYGDVYSLYPIGDFRYTWSPKWADWTASSGMYDMYDLMELPDDVWIDMDDKNITRLQDRLKYLLDRYGHDYYLNADLYTEETLNKLIKVDTGLRDAIRKRNEIMIYCEKYLLIVGSLAEPIQRELWRY